MSKLKYNVGDEVQIKSLDWYNQMLSIPSKIVGKDDFAAVECGAHIFTKAMCKFCGKVMTIQDIGIDFYIMKEDNLGYEFTDEMIERLVVDETHKYKIDDIVFVKNLGWVRITNLYWDPLANGYIYEAIGFNGEGKYDHINQYNIECQMLPESENPHTRGNKITLGEYKNNDKEWLFNKLATLDNITALESIQDIFNYLQQLKYPKTYEESCRILGVCSEETLQYGDLTLLNDYEFNLYTLLENFRKLRICRDAYWKIAGEEMGLGKPWEPDWTNQESPKYCIASVEGQIKTGERYIINTNLAFPTAEIRDDFKRNFDPDIEKCKVLL